jgi:hypothetical protein
MKWIYVAFWVFIGVMLLWQFSNYNHSLDQKVAAAGPQQQHFFFNSKSHDTSTMSTTPGKLDGASVKQVDFRVETDKPVIGNFTCHVTLKNIGNKKATGVMVKVTPFRGVASGDGEDGRVTPVPLPDSDPIAQISQWLNFPDMAPGQTLTQDAVFVNNYQYSPGENPNPIIQFKTAP